jgi:hypothetical protein
LCWTTNAPWQQQHLPGIFSLCPHPSRAACPRTSGLCRWRLATSRSTVPGRWPFAPLRARYRDPAPVSEWTLECSLSRYHLASSDDTQLLDFRCSANSGRRAEATALPLRGGSNCSSGSCCDHGGIVLGKIRNCQKCRANNICSWGSMHGEGPTKAEAQCPDPCEPAPAVLALMQHFTRVYATRPGCLHSVGLQRQPRQWPNKPLWTTGRRTPWILRFALMCTV